LVRGHVGVACLTTAAELEANGSEMGHCVRNYAMSCLEGRCHIVGFYLDGRAAATAELSGSTDLGFTAVQMRGRRNGDAPAETRQALDLILRELNGGAPARQPAGARCGAGVAACRDADPAGARPLAAPSFRPMGLAVTPDAVLADALAGRQEALARHRASLSANYEVSDPEAVDRVATAWRFAMPDRMRAAWEAGRTPAERIAAAGAVLLQEKRRRLQTSAESLAEHRGQAAHP
jgi:hypothetical protein